MIALVFFDIFLEEVSSTLSYLRGNTIVPSSADQLLYLSIGYLAAVTPIVQLSTV